MASKSNGSWQVKLFSYDSDGRVVKRYQYTHANGGTTVLTALNTTDTLTLDLQGAVTRRHLTVGSNTWYQWFDYDARGLLWKAFASTSSTKPGTPDVTYTYRPSGQVENRQFLGGPLVPVRYTIREQLEKIGAEAVPLRREQLDEHAGPRPHQHHLRRSRQPEDAPALPGDRDPHRQSDVHLSLRDLAAWTTCSRVRAPQPDEDTTGGV